MEVLENSDSTRCNDFKVKEGRLRFDIRNKFLTQRVVRNSNKLPKETLDAPFL